MASKKRLAAKRLRAKRDMTPKPRGKSEYAKKVRRGYENNPRSPFYVSDLHRAPGVSEDG